MKITKAGKQAFLLGLNKITDMFGKSDLIIENEVKQAKIEEAEANLAVWQGKYDKLKADLDRRTAERDAARKEKKDLERALSQKNEELSALESDLIKSRKETLRLGRIAEPWNHTLADVVKIDRCDTMRTPGGHAFRLHLESCDRKLISVFYAHHEKYRKGEISLEHLIAIYATHDIDVAVARKLDRLDGKEFQSALAKLANTMFHALPAILYPALAAQVGISHGINGYVGIRHKFREDILRE